MRAGHPNRNLAGTYATFGVPVFPCRESGERAKSPYVANGYHQATADADILKHWSRTFPTALYGLPCAPNGLFVLDADRHGNGDGVANLMSLFAAHKFDSNSVPAVETPGGGMKEVAKGGGFQLQGHGNPVFYRNIWVLPKP